jgi:hypothetical protein
MEKEVVAVIAMRRCRHNRRHRSMRMLLESGDDLRLLVIEDVEGRLRKAMNGIALGIGHGDVGEDDARLSAEGVTLVGALRVRGLRCIASLILAGHRSLRCAGGEGCCEDEDRRGVPQKHLSPHAQLTDGRLG